MLQELKCYIANLILKTSDQPHKSLSDYSDRNAHSHTLVVFFQLCQCMYTFFLLQSKYTQFCAARSLLLWFLLHRNASSFHFQSFSTWPRFKFTFPEMLSLGRSFTPTQSVAAFPLFSQDFVFSSNSNIHYRLLLQFFIRPFF